MRLPLRLRSPLEDWPPSLWANHGPAGIESRRYVEGQNVTIEYRWAEGHYDRLAALAADLVGREVDIIAAGSAPSARAAKNATSDVRHGTDLARRGHRTEEGEARVWQ